MSADKTDWELENALTTPIYRARPVDTAQDVAVTEVTEATKDTEEPEDAEETADPQEVTHAHKTVFVVFITDTQRGTKYAVTYADTPKATDVALKHVGAYVAALPDFTVHVEELDVAEFKRLYYGYMLREKLSPAVSVVDVRHALVAFERNHTQVPQSGTSTGVGGGGAGEHVPLYRPLHRTPRRDR